VYFQHFFFKAGKLAGKKMDEKYSCPIIFLPNGPRGNFGGNLFFPF